MAMDDKMIVCVDCGQEFVHSAEDQARYAQRGFTNEPKRCRGCREKRKAQAGGRGRASASAGAPRSGSYGAGDQDRPREFFEVTCSECGAATKVPFKPTKDRPVFCLDCFRAKRGNR